MTWPDWPWPDILRQIYATASYWLQTLKSMTQNSEIATENRPYTNSRISSFTVWLRERYLKTWVNTLLFNTGFSITWLTFL